MIERRLCDAAKAAAYLDISPRLFTELVSSGVFKQYFIKTLVRYKYEDLDAYIETLPSRSDKARKSPNPLVRAKVS